MLMWLQPLTRVLAVVWHSRSVPGQFLSDLQIICTPPMLQTVSNAPIKQMLPAQGTILLFSALHKISLLLTV
jgi:hypothetical protein